MTEQSSNIVSPDDYRDFDLQRLQVLADYITKQSVPVNMTFQEVQQVVLIYTEFLNDALHNLNLLRQLAGKSNFPIPESVREMSDA